MLGQYALLCLPLLDSIPLLGCAVFCRLCWVWRWDQAGPISPRPGETVACQLFQMSDLQHGPNRRVHQQVSVDQITNGFYISRIFAPLTPSRQPKYVSDRFEAVWFLLLWQRWSAILRSRLPRPVWGEMWDLHQIHQWKSSGGETKRIPQH